MQKMITILGPTASGKTPVAARLAVEIDGEVISADSRQVYRRMDIGTGKDLADYVFDDKLIPYHLIDIYDLFRFINNKQRFPANCNIPLVPKKRQKILQMRLPLLFSAIGLRHDHFSISAVPVPAPVFIRP
jgi:hypothetical protein